MSCICMKLLTDVACICMKLLTDVACRCMKLLINVSYIYMKRFICFIHQSGKWIVGNLCLRNYAVRTKDSQHDGSGTVSVDMQR